MRAFVSNGARGTVALCAKMYDEYRALPAELDKRHSTTIKKLKIGGGTN